MALLLALPLRQGCRRLATVLWWIAASLIVILIIGSGIRSQWLVLPVGLATYAFLVAGRNRLLSRPVVVFTGTAVVVIAVVTALTAWWWTHPRRNLVTGALDSREGHGNGTALAVLPAKSSGAIRVRGVLSCQGTGWVAVTVQDARTPRGGGAVPGERLDVSVVASVPSPFVFVLDPESLGNELRLGLDDPAQLQCTSTTLTVERVRPAMAARIFNRIAEVTRRAPNPQMGHGVGTISRDPSIAYRINEMAAIVNAIRTRSWSSFIVGQGLGATFLFNGLGYDDHGNLVPLDRMNYIHNFYLFLLFKLGTLGTVEVLSALTLFLLTAVRAARDPSCSGADLRFLAAAAAAWITYLLWSVASPEILDFRFAPFWGALVGLTASTLARRE
jgi:hypothetical protein